MIIASTEVFVGVEDGLSGADLHRFGQLGDDAVEFAVGAPVLRLLVRQLVLDVEQHRLDDVELVGHLRFQVVQPVLDLACSTHRRRRRRRRRQRRRRHPKWSPPVNLSIPTTLAEIHR